MVRAVKSLLFNLGYGVNVQRHREHRSKRGRNKYDKDNSPAFLKYKEKKWREKYEIDE